MTAGSKCRLAALALIGVSACVSSTQDPRTPNAREQRRLDAQTERVFAKVAPLDDAQWNADRQAVERLHLLAYWIRSYERLAGHYPLADRLGEDLDFVQCLVYGDDSNVDYERRVNLRADLLLLALRERLGEDLTLPKNPDPSSRHAMHYTTNGRGFAVAVDLRHAVNGGEMVASELCQYRIASYENAALPIHSLARILAGGVDHLDPVHWRDPSLRAAR